MFGDTDSISMYWKNDHALKLLQMFGQSLGKVSGHALNKLAPTYLKFGKELNKVNCLVSVCLSSPTKHFECLKMGPTILGNVKVSMDPF